MNIHSRTELRGQIEDAIVLSWLMDGGDDRYAPFEPESMSARLADAILRMDDNEVWQRTVELEAQR